MYRKLGRTAPRLKVISPGRYPDFSAPPYTRSSNAATPAANSAAEPSHAASAPGGRLAGRRQRTARTVTTAQPSTTMFV